MLQEKYPDTPIRAFGKVVVLEFAETKHSVELLPAWEQSDGRFLVPNSENGGSWELWDPRREINKIQDSDATTGKTRSLIRMLKKWSENCTARIKSFEIENKVLEFFASGHSAKQTYPALLKQFLNYFHTTVTNSDLRSHVNTALNRATKACELEEAHDLEGAVDEWRKIFGDDFPAAIQEAFVADDSMPALADHSHCEAPKWPIAERAKVRIDASVYDRSKTKKLGGINTNGRGLHPGFHLRYQARTAETGPFDYYWQVVNTGAAAKAAAGLRGNIFSGREVRWESTLYPGKHWIECFLVCDNVCIARSGKFVINIK
jgi:hypothetical protein